MTALGSTYDVKTDGAHSAVAEIGEEELLADPERLAALAAAYGTDILGDYPRQP